MAKNKRVKGIVEHLLAPALIPMTLILLFAITAISIIPGDGRAERETTENKENQWE